MESGYGDKITDFMVLVRIIDLFVMVEKQEKVSRECLKINGNRDTKYIKDYDITCTYKTLM